MGVARGDTWAMLAKVYKFHNVSPFCQFYKKVVLRLNEHDDVIETQIIKIWPPKFFSKLGTWLSACAHGVKSEISLDTGNYRIGNNHCYVGQPQKSQKKQISSGFFCFLKKSTHVKKSFLFLKIFTTWLQKSQIGNAAGDPQSCKESNIF